MVRCGWSWAMCRTAVLAAAMAAPLDAAPFFPGHATAEADSGAMPVIVPAPTRGQDRAFAGPAPSASSAAVPEYPMSHRDDAPTGYAERLTLPGVQRPSSVNTAGWTHSVSLDAVPVSRRWIAVVGSVAKPGCHELTASSITVADLIERCGGLTSSSATLAVVRGGKPLGLVYNPQDRLLAGDVVVVRGAERQVSGVAIATQSASTVSEGSPAGVQLGLVNVLDHPVPVMVPASHATVAGVLSIADQKHLRPADVKVVLAGTDEVFGDQAGPLLPGSVLVFEPGSIDAQALGEVETRHYLADPPAPAPPEPLPPTPMQIEPSLRTLQPAPSSAFESFDAGRADEPFASPQGRAISQAPSDLSSIPSVDMLDAPADETMRFPRTADASGAVPIGPPEADSHIVPLPSDAIYGAPPSASNDSFSSTAAPMPPPVTLSENDPAPKKSTRGTPSFEELAPTVFLGTILGAATFLILRRWSGRQIFDAISRRFQIIRGIGNRTGSIERVEAERRRFTPDDMLAALIADRLAFREEPVALPQALRIHGRTAAQHYRRVDAATASVPEPHIPATAPIANRRPTERTTGGNSNAAVKTKQASAGVRIDPPQPTTTTNRAHSDATPFERALAAMRTDQRASGVR